MHKPLHTGTCGKCGERCYYIASTRVALWVHELTGNFIGIAPEWHDCNTYIVRDPKD